MIALLRKLFVRPRVETREDIWSEAVLVPVVQELPPYAALRSLLIETDDQGRLFCRCPQCVGSSPELSASQVLDKYHVNGCVFGQLCDDAGVPPEQQGGKQTWRDGLPP